MNRRSDKAVAEDESEQMPVGWTATPLFSLCELIRGVSYKKGEARAAATDGHIALLRANNIDCQIVYEGLQYIPAHRVKERQRVRVGDVVVAMSSGSKLVVGKTATIEKKWDGAFGAFCGVLRPNEITHAAFFGLFFQTHEYRSAISEASAGTNINNLSRDHFEAILIPLPPLAEQKRIAAKVGAVLAKVDAARRRLAKVPAILKRFRQSVLAAACSGRLTEDWRDGVAAIDGESATKMLIPLALREINIRDDLELGVLPHNWIWSDICALMDPQESFCYGVVQPGLDDADGVFLVRAGDLKNGTVETNNLRRVPVHVDELYKRSRLRGGEVLVTVVGAGIGTAVMAPKHCVGYNIARAVAKIPIRQNSPEYVLRWMETSTAREWMDGDAREVARPTLNLEQLKTLPVPLPPLPEQHEIVRRVSELFALADKVEARLSAATAAADRITRATLAKAFRGELVETEASLARRERRAYEPADKLLERIRAEKTAAPPKPRPQRKRAKKAAKQSPAAVSKP